MKIIAPLLAVLVRSATYSGPGWGKLEQQNIRETYTSKVHCRLKKLKACNEANPTAWAPYMCSFEIGFSNCESIIVKSSRSACLFDDNKVSCAESHPAGRIV